MLHPLCEAPSISNETETFLFINVVRLQYMIYDAMYHFDKKEKKSRKLQLLSLKSFISGGEKTNKHTHTKKPKQFHCELLWQGRRGRLYCSPNPYLLGFISHKNENKNHHSGLGSLMMNPKLAGCMVTTNPFK